MCIKVAVIITIASRLVSKFKKVTHVKFKKIAEKSRVIQ